MNDILTFDNMLTPKIITLVYWLLLLIAVFSGVGSMFIDFTISSFFMGIVYTVGGAIGARIWCELLIVLFKIHENLQKIADKSSET